MYRFLEKADITKFFGIRLHQIFSGPGKLQATMEPDGRREFSLKGERYVAGDGDMQRRYYPVHFCRSCGHEFMTQSRSAALQRVSDRRGGGRRHDARLFLFRRDFSDDLGRHVGDSPLFVSAVLSKFADLLPAALQ